MLFETSETGLILFFKKWFFKPFFDRTIYHTLGIQECISYYSILSYCVLNRHFKGMHRCNYRFLYILMKKDLPTILALALSSHNFPTDRARELLKPSKEANSLLGSIKKDFSTFAFKFFKLTSRLAEVWRLLDDVIRSWQKGQVEI